MVSAISLNSTAFCNYLNSTRQCIVPKETHAYYSRSTKQNLNFVSKYIENSKELLNTLINTDPNKAVKLACHIRNVCDKSNLYANYPDKFRYEQVFDGVEVDDAAILEAIGAMDAARPIQVIYSVTPHLANLLAFICGDSSEIIERNLRNNCDKYNISYDNFAYAVCNLDTLMFPYMDINILNGVSRNLDMCITRLQHQPHKAKFSIGNGKLDLTDPTMQLNTRLTSFILFQVTCLSQFIFDQIISAYDEDNTRNYFLTSKGPGTLIFQTNGEKPPADLRITLGNDKPWTLNTVSVQRGGYSQAIAKGWI